MSLDPLNDKEINLLIDYGLKWSKIGLSTEKLNLNKAIKAIQMAYDLAGLDVPHIFLGPFETPLICARAQIIVKQTKETVNITDIDFDVELSKGNFSEKDIAQALNEQLFGSFDACWLGSYDYINKLETDALIEIKGLVEVAKECFWWAPYDRVVFLQEKPLEIHLNAKGELHNDKGPAIKWRGNNSASDIYAINGKPVKPFN